MYLAKFLTSVFLVVLHLNLMAQHGYDKTILQEYYQNQEYAKALNYLQQYNADLQGSSYRQDLGYAYYMNDMMSDALTVYKSIYLSDSNHLTANLYLALLYKAGRKLDSALFYYTKLTNLSPENYLYPQNVALIWQRKKNTDSALHYIANSYQLNPNAALTVTTYAGLLFNKKQIDSAQKLVDDFLKNDSTNAEVIAQKVDFSFDLHKYEDVIHWAKKLQDGNIADMNAYILLGFSYLNSLEFDEVIHLLQWARGLDVASESLIYCAALAHARKKEYAQSNELLDECLGYNLIFTATAYFRAKAENYIQTKQYKHAVQLLDSSYYIFKDPEDLYRSGSIYDEHLHDKPKAIAYYKRYLATPVNPEAPDDKRIREYIKKYNMGQH